MTTICYRDGVMAADSRAYSGDKVPIGTKQKIHVMPNGALLASSSTLVGMPEAFTEWVRRTIVNKEAVRAASTDENFGVQSILVWPDGEVFYWCDGRHWAGPVKAEFFALGSGDQYAYGAMKAGASAEKAVRIACECDTWSSEPVQVVTLADGIEQARSKRGRKKGAIA